MIGINLLGAYILMAVLVPLLVATITLAMQRRALPLCGGLGAASLITIWLIAGLLRPVFAEGDRHCFRGGPSSEEAACLERRRRSGADPQPGQFVACVAVPTLIGLAATLGAPTLVRSRRPRRPPSE